MVISKYNIRNVIPSCIRSYQEINKYKLNVSSFVLSFIFIYFLKLLEIEQIIVFKTNLKSILREKKKCTNKIYLVKLIASSLYKEYKKQNKCILIYHFRRYFLSFFNTFRLKYNNAFQFDTFRRVCQTKREFGIYYI